MSYVASLIVRRIMNSISDSDIKNAWEQASKQQRRNNMANDTVEFLEQNKMSHPIKIDILETFLRPSLKIQYLPNYDEEWDRMQFAKIGDACFDLRAAIDKEVLTIPPGTKKAIPNGFICEVPPPFVLRIYARSGLSKKEDLSLANGVGTIDQGFRGEVKTLLKNKSNNDVIIVRGQRISQASLELCPMPRLVEDELNMETKRGAGGFGHTGV